MDMLIEYVVPFLVILTVLVFVHELGHFWIARRAGVRVQTFSIGFGPELFGWTDRSNTRWKISALPLGGYVKMFGDTDPSSRASSDVAEMTPEERAVSFHHKRLSQRTWIVLGGPLANFIFAIVVLAGLFMTYGQPFTPAVVSEVQPGSAAAEAGIQPGDRILSINGTAIDRFEDVRRIVQLNPGAKLSLVVERDGTKRELHAVAKSVEVDDGLGGKQVIGLLGVTSNTVEVLRRGPLSAIANAGEETLSITVGTLEAVGQIITGRRNAEELGGPLRIAQMSGKVAERSFDQVLWFMAVLSINLGLINLFPIPVLDGGHLLLYGIEAIRGRPLGERTMEIGFGIGLAMVLCLMLFATWNDLVHLNVVEYVKGLVS
jgi:regulator of sigma E protease